MGVNIDQIYQLIILKIIILKNRIYVFDYNFEKYKNEGKGWLWIEQDWNNYE